MTDGKKENIYKILINLVKLIIGLWLIYYGIKNKDSSIIAAGSYLISTMRHEVSSLIQFIK